MAQVVRQSNLLAAEDWRTIYRAFTEVNFNAYDFDSIRQSMLEYMQVNYPEDFNDYIASSEFSAIMDLLAYLGQSLAFRMDLNTRENFIDTAERRESLLRLARLINYQPSRNRASNGLLKVVSVSTNEDVLDSNNDNLANTRITFNDSNNPDWYEQFIQVMNSALSNNSPFGEPVKEGTVGGIATQLYQFNSVSGITPAIDFSTTVAGTPASFEITNADFEDGGSFNERSPNTEDAKYIIFRSDGSGFNSENTGFFFQFKQGNLQSTDVQFVRPVENRLEDIDVENINETDVYVQNVDNNGSVISTWTQVPSIPGNNIIFNNINREERNIYNVVTRENDQISIRFADGRFGNIPTGIFRIWYRTSIGERLKIRPKDIGDQTIQIPYFNTSGQRFVLTLTLRLQETLDNSAPPETNEQIRRRAPQVYYTQNRMVNGQDYNTFPLQNSQALKVKAVNRTYSGHSRYIDINDPTASREDANVFSDDGILYKELNRTLNELPLPTSLSAQEIIQRNIQTLVSSTELSNFLYEYYDENVNELIELRAQNPFQYSNLNRFDRLEDFGDKVYKWIPSENFNFFGTGKLVEETNGTKSDVAIGDFGVNELSNIREGSLLKFVYDDKEIWTSVVTVLENGKGIIDPSGEGKIKLSNPVPVEYTLARIIPNYRLTLNSTEKQNIAFEINNENTFGITFDYSDQTWKVISEENLAEEESDDFVTDFSLRYQGDNSFNNRDNSWLIRAEYKPSGWVFKSRGVNYVFESKNDVRFFFFDRFRTVSGSTGATEQDFIKVFKTNPKPSQVPGVTETNEPLEYDYLFSLDSAKVEEDGFVDSRRVFVKPWDGDFDGLPDQPKIFNKISGESNYVFQRLDTSSDIEKYDSFEPVLITSPGDLDKNSPENKLQQIKETQVLFILSNNDIQTSDSVLRSNRFYELKNGIDLTNNDLISRGSNYNLVDVENNKYRRFTGRSSINFQWKHFAPREQRIDPSITNVVDIFVLESNFDTAIREWIENNGSNLERPETPTSQDLSRIFSDVEDFKMISDEIIWRPVEHKILFGTQAEEELRAKFKVVKIPNTELSDGEIKSQVVQAINDFFLPENWDFGETFYASELNAFIHLRLPTDVASVALVPLNEESSFGRLYEIRSNSNEIFVSSARVSDIEIIESNSAANLRIQ